MLKKYKIILMVMLLILLVGMCNNVKAAVKNPVVVGSKIELLGYPKYYEDAKCTKQTGRLRKGVVCTVVAENSKAIRVKTKSDSGYILKTSKYKKLTGTTIKSGDGKTHDGHYKDLEGTTFILYRQGYYKSIDYWTGTIATDGCGPTSSAIISSGYNKKITPASIVKSEGEWYGSRSKLNNYFVNLNKKMNKRKNAVKYINGYETKITKNSIKDTLANGYEVIVNVQDGKVGNTYYEGHYYTILDIEKGTDNVFVADPGPVSTKLKNNGWYDIDELTGIKNVFYIKL